MGSTLAPLWCRHGPIRKILEEASGSMRNAVKMTTYVTDMGQTVPASTAVEVSGLVKSGLLIEIEAVAVV